jgi:hypothetical protein
MIMKTILNLISFRGNYLTATFVYIGLGLLLFAITPDSPSVNAQGNGCGGEAACSGEDQCCNGTCIPKEQCCETSDK